MIVEDDDDIRETVRALLEAESYPVVTATNGKEALELLRAAPELPALVFLDLMMPVMGGETVLAELRSEPRLAELPVVVLTAVRKKLEGRLVITIPKPVDLDDLLFYAETFASSR